MSSLMMRQSWLLTAEAIPSSAARENTAPLGLLGLLSTMARVRGVSARRVAHPVGREDDDLIAVVQQRLEGVVQRVLGPHGHQHLIRREGELVVTLELGADSLAQLGDARGGCVLREARLQAVDGRLLDEV